MRNQNIIFKMEGMQQIAGKINTKIFLPESSSVARGWGRGGYSPPIGLSTKMQNKKNNMFLALLRLLFCVGMD